MAEEMTFKVEDVEIKPVDYNTDVPKCNKVRIKTPDAPEGFVTIKPRQFVEKEKKVNGYKVTSTEAEPYPVTQLPEAFNTLVQALKDNKNVELTGNFETYDQRETGDGEKVYHYMEASEVENIKLVEA